MEKSREFAKSEVEKAESEYNFKEIADIEPAMTSLVEKLKENIEVGKYDVLISDEVGGRIPTIVLRKIISEKNPDKDIKGYFLSSGRGDINFKAVKNFISENELFDKKALIVTEYISTGGSMREMSQALEEGGLNEFDVAAVYLNSYADDRELKIIEKNHKIFDGVSVFDTPKFYFEQETFGGVRKFVDIHERLELHPRRAENFKEEVQPVVDEAHEDANLLAENVIKKVWG